MANELDLFYDLVLEITKQAGELIKESLKKGVKVETKECDIDFVTETDQQVEKFITHSLSAKFPEHKFIGEETISAGGKCVLTNDPTWVIDPIDGTMNFVHRFPHSCISVALFVDSVPVIGIIYNPVLGQLFTAKKGAGAFLNGEQIHVSKETTLSNALLMMENGTSRDEERGNVLFANQQKLIPIVHGVRSLGSAALDMAMVAAGFADAYFEYGIHIWDIGAGEIIVKEAGGIVIDPEGGPVNRLSRRVLCASTEALGQELAKNLTQFYPQPTD